MATLRITKDSSLEDIIYAQNGMNRLYCERMGYGTATLGMVEEIETLNTMLLAEREKNSTSYASYFEALLEKYSHVIHKNENLIASNLRNKERVQELSTENNTLKERLQLVQDDSISQISGHYNANRKLSVEAAELRRKVADLEHVSDLEEKVLSSKIKYLESKIAGLEAALKANTPITTESSPDYFEDLVAKLKTSRKETLAAGEKRMVARRFLDAIQDVLVSRGRTSKLKNIEHLLEQYYNVASVPVLPEDIELVGELTRTAEEQTYKLKAAKHAKFQTTEGTEL